MAWWELNRFPQVPSPFSSSSHSSLIITATKCQKWYCSFCILCKVPWHTDMSCEEYAPQLGAASAELNLLAENNKWKRCPNCKHMIERTGGYRHIICRYTISEPWSFCLLEFNHNLIGKCLCFLFFKIDFYVLILNLFIFRCNHVFCYQCGRIPWKGNCDCIWK